MTKEQLLELKERRGWIDTHEFLLLAYPNPKYTVEDCQDWTPDQLGF